MEKVEIFKLLLRKEYYNAFNHKLDMEIFPSALHDFYESLVEAHKQTKEDVTPRMLYSVHIVRFPALTDANKNVIIDIVKSISEAEDIPEDMAEFLIDKALLELKATRIAQAALAIAHGKSEDFSEIESLLRTDVTVSTIELVTTDVVALVDSLSNTYRWHFNLPDLDQAVGAIGPEVFGIFAGPVNSGKSAMGISFTFGPKGFAEQGAKTVYIGNEESLKRTMMRGVSCWSGMTKTEILDNPLEAQKRFDEIRENIFLIDDYSMTFNKLHHVMDKLTPDIVILDMLDKVKVSGVFQRDDQRLGKIAEMARETAKKYQCAVFGLSQTNGDTFGQLIIEQNELSGSRVDKAANADLVLTLGSLPSAEDNNNFRRIFVAKSKLEGDKAKINCQLLPHISRIVP